ncbi:MAG: hypothetical protein ABI685_07600 [Ferruginibacter sp.]
MSPESKNKITKEILTDISLVGCFLNMLTLVTNLYLFSNKNSLVEYLYLITLSVTTLLCVYGILKLREGKTAGFKFYFYGQTGELIFYIIVLVFITIPGVKDRVKIDNFLAGIGFVKNIIPLLLMTFLHYISIKKIYIKQV